MRLFACDGVKARPSAESSRSPEVCMSACTVWEFVLTVAVVVFAGLAYHYRNVARRMKTRARIYIQYVPRDQLTGEERIVLDALKKDLGLT